MLNELLSLNVFHFFLIFARLGTVFMFMPGFSGRYVSTRIRLALGLSVCFLLLPFLSPLLPQMPSTPSGLTLLVAGEILIGAFLGAMARIVMGAVQTAGTLISMFSSLANALVQDAVSEQQSSVVSGFLGTIAVMLIFVTNLHHLMLEAVVDTYAVFTPGVFEGFGGFAMMMARGVSASFALGLQLSSPFLIVAMVYYVGLGLLGRLMPALPLFFFMMPIQISLQFMVMMATLSGIMMIFLGHFQDTFLMFSNP